MINAINNIVEGQEMSFEDALSVIKIYDELPEPNSLIDEAEEMAASDIEALEKLTTAIKEESERFLDCGLPLLKNIDFKAIAQSYPTPFKSDHLKQLFQSLREELPKCFTRFHATNLTLPTKSMHRVFGLTPFL